MDSWTEESSFAGLEGEVTAEEPIAAEEPIVAEEPIAAEEPVSPITQGEDLKPVDKVEVIVNDEILTYRQVIRATVERIKEGSQPTAKQFDELRNRVGSDLVNEHLQVQGGIDMGFDSQIVERLVNSNIERRIDAVGGIIPMTDKLSQSGHSVTAQKAALRRSLYQGTYDQSITGRGAGVSGRAHQDRYVRPGRLYLYHEQLKAGQLGAEAIGGTSALYSLQELILPVPSEAEIDRVRAQAEGLYHEVSEGAKFTEIIRAQPKPPEKDGMLPPLSGLDLARIGGLEVAAFVLSATPGELSRPLPILIGGRPVAWRIIKLIKAEKPILPIFSLPKTQLALKRALQEETDEQRRRAGLKTLSDGAFVWIATGDQNT